MSKVSFSKLGLKKNETFEVLTFNDNEIEVKQYLPIDDKLALIEAVVNKSIGEADVINPLIIDAHAALEMVYAYTNITFTDKQKEDEAKLYDLLESNGLVNAVIEKIPHIEYESIMDSIEEIVADYNNHKRSLLGVMENINQDYLNLDAEATNIEKKLANKENITLLKEVIDKMD